VKLTKNDCYFNRHGCSLYRNKARLSESQILVTVTKSFFCVFVPPFVTSPGGAREKTFNITSLNLLPNAIFSPAAGCCRRKVNRRTLDVDVCKKKYYLYFWTRACMCLFSVFFSAHFFSFFLEHTVLFVCFLLFCSLFFFGLRHDY